MPRDSVTVGADFKVIQHNKNSLTIPVFVATNWPTGYWDSVPDRTLNSAKIYFTSPASGADPQITWRIVE
jgi:hypothetical protein